MNFKIRVGGPTIDKEDIESVANTLKEGRLSCGIVGEKFETQFAKFTNVKYAVAVNSATSALQLMLAANDIGLGDEVITTPYTYAATANVIVLQGAKPVFVDIESDFFNIDPSKIEEKITKNTKAIMPIHYGGQASKMDEILKISKKHNLLVFEDAAPATGAKFNEKKVGSIGNAAAFSFFPDKNMTTGEGGMLTTNSDKIARRVQIMKKNGAKSRYYHTEIGWNFKMPDINAALGITQLKKLPGIIIQKNESAKIYTDLFSEKLGDLIQTPKVMKGSFHTFNLYSVKFQNKKQRDKVKKYLAMKRIETRVCFPPVHLQPIYSKILKIKRGEYPISETCADTTLCMPLFTGISQKIQEQIVGYVKIAIGN